MAPDQRAALDAIDAAVRALRDSLADAETPVDPPVEPPVPPAASGELHVERVDLTKLVYFNGWHDNGSNVHA